MADRVRQMNQRFLALALAGVFVCAPAWAESSRLAFSKAENIEIFVEHAAGTPWCSEQPELKVVYHGAPDADALGRLLPKLGALLGQQCPQAGAVTWRSLDNAGKPLAQGTSSKAAQWQMVVAAPAPAADVQAAVASTTPQAAVSAATPVAPAAPPADTDQSVAKAVPSSPVAPVEAKQPVAAPQAAQDNAGRDVVQQATSVDAASQAASADPASQAPAAALGAAGFTVKDWQPRAEADVLARASFIKEMQDQNGCRVRAAFDLGDDAQYVSLLTEGLTCNPAGYAQGMGNLVLRRTDGAVIGRANKVYFTDGFAFDEPVQVAHLAETNGKDTVWFNLGSSQTAQAYYLMRTKVSRGYVFSTLHVNGDLDVVTAQEALFRQAQDISQAVQAALLALQTTALPQARQINVRFADSPEGALRQDRDHMMYALYASRDWDYAKRRPKGDWKFRLDQGENYVFLRERRQAEEARQRQLQAEREEQQRQQQLAWEKRLAQQKKAMESQRLLSQYQELVAKDQAAPDSLLSQYFVKTQSYVPLQGGQYARLYAGKAVSFQQVVHVAGYDGEDAVTDFPYDMRIANGKKLEKSWYAIKGEARADQQRLDKDDLPMTVVSATPAGGIQLCKQAGCADLSDPLTVMRLINGLPNWTPEAAQKQIDEANGQG